MWYLSPVLFLLLEWKRQDFHLRFCLELPILEYTPMILYVPDRRTMGVYHKVIVCWISLSVWFLPQILDWSCVIDDLYLVWDHAVKWKILLTLVVLWLLFAVVILTWEFVLLGFGLTPTKSRVLINNVRVQLVLRAFLADLYLFLALVFGRNRNNIITLYLKRSPGGHW